MGWQETAKGMESEGYSQQEIYDAQNQIRQEMQSEGYLGPEIDDAFGIKSFNKAPVKAHVEDNIKTYEAARAPEGSTSPKPKLPDAIDQPDAKEADGFIEAIEAGFQMSTAGLIARGKRPDIMVSENAGMFYRIAEQIGNVVGDIPAMLIGGVAGEVVGLGNPIAAGAGAFALPQGLRKFLMDGYDKGSINSFSDFWERASAAFIEAGKGGLIGGATAGVGGIAGKFGTGMLSQTVSKSAAEIATMVTVGSALEGKIPEPQEFLDAAIVVGALHGTGKIAGRLRETYAKTNIAPAETGAESVKNPQVKEQILAENPDFKKISEQLGGEKVPDLPEDKPEAIAEKAIAKAIAPVEPAENTPPPTEPPVEGGTGEGGEPPKTGFLDSLIKDKTKSEKWWKSYDFNKFYTDFVDKLHPINEAVKLLATDPVKALTDITNPYSLARMANDYKAKLMYTVKKGVYDFKTGALVKDIKSFDSIVSQWKDDPGFQKFMVAERVIELDKRKINAFGDKTTINGQEVTHAQILAESEQLSKDGQAKYGESAKELVKWSNGVLAIARDSGRISPELFTKLTEANQKYIPFSRVLEEISGGVGVANPIKAIRGSEKAIVNPLMSMIENANTLLRFSEINRSRVAMIEMAEKNDAIKYGPFKEGTVGYGLFEKVETSSRKIEISKEEMQKYFDKHGIEADAKTMDIYRKQAKINLASNEFEIWRNGEREVYKTNADLAKSLNSLDGDVSSQNVLLKIAGGFTQFKKFGIAITPDFVLKNIFRDQFLKQALGGGSGGQFIWDTVVAMGDILKQREPYYNWLKSGGANGSFIETGHIIKDSIRLQEETGMWNSKYNILKSAKDFMGLAGNIAESATRLAEFKRSVEMDAGGGKARVEGAASKDVSGNALFKGGMASREATVDFQRIGAQMSALNSITAFQNISIQGLDRTIRAGADAVRGIKADPTTAFDHPFVKGAGLITTASVTLWAINHDQEWYQEIPRWEKDTFWHMKVGGVIFRLPKPQELGIAFGSIPERILETYAAHNPEGGKDFAETLQNLMMPSYIPDAISPFLEQKLNKSIFTGNAIVSQSAERLLPPEQYNDYTSETSKIIGKGLGYLPILKDFGSDGAKLQSPMVIDNYIRSWSGPFGMYVAKAVDQALYATHVSVDYKPESTIADWPFVKAFVTRYPSAGAESIKDFRENFKEASRIKATADVMLATGRGDEAVQLLNSRSDDMQKLNEINSNISNAGILIQKIMHTDTPKDEKRNQIDMIYYSMIQMARMGNGITQEFRDIMKGKSK